MKMDRFFQHFGHTETFKIYDVEEGKVVHSRNSRYEWKRTWCISGSSNALNDVLICGGIDMVHRQH